MSSEDSVAKSIKQRLLNVAVRRREDYNLLLSRYVALRFLARLSQSKYAGTFLLKGATMFLVWSGEMHRPTRDIDLLGLEARDPDEIKSVIREICQIEGNSDGIQFDLSTLSTFVIREDNPGGGVRATIVAKIGMARQPVKIDIVYGDAVDFVPVELPTLLIGQPTTKVRGYLVLVAEKFEAMVKLGIANSRMKDFLDLAVISDSMALDPKKLKEAINALFQRRGTEFPEDRPFSLTEQFWSDPKVNLRWSSFVKKNRVQTPFDSLKIVCGQIASMIGFAFRPSL